MDVRILNVALKGREGGTLQEPPQTFPTLTIRDDFQGKKNEMSLFFSYIFKHRHAKRLISRLTLAFANARPLQHHGERRTSSHFKMCIGLSACALLPDANSH